MAYLKRVNTSRSLLQKQRALPYKVRQELNGPRKELLQYTTLGQTAEGYKSLALRFSSNEWKVLNDMLKDYKWNCLTSARGYSGHPEDYPDYGDEMTLGNLGSMVRLWLSSMQTGKCSEGFEYYELNVVDTLSDSPYGPHQDCYGVKEMLALLFWLKTSTRFKHEMWDLRWDNILQTAVQAIDHRPTHLVNKLSPRTIEYFEECVFSRADVESEEKDDIRAQLKKVLPLPIFNPKDAFDLHKSLYDTDYAGEWPWNILPLIYNATEDLVEQEYYWQLYLPKKDGTVDPYGYGRAWDFGTHWMVETYEEYCLHLWLSPEGVAKYEPSVGSYGGDSDYQTGYYDPGILCVADWHSGDMITRLKDCIIELEELIAAEPRIGGAQNIVKDLKREIVAFENKKLEK